MSGSEKLCVCLDDGHRLAVAPGYLSLDGLLPESYKHTVCQYRSLADGFSAEIRINATTDDDARRWVLAYQEKTKTTLRVLKSNKIDGKKVVFQRKYRCQHNSLPRSRTAELRLGSKNTNCPFSMKVTVRKRPFRPSQSKDIHATTLPMIINLDHVHNHPIDCLDALKHRDVSDSVKQIFMELFKANHTATTALVTYKYDLHEEKQHDFLLSSGDRAICPDKSWVYRLYYREFGKMSRLAEDEGMLTHLEEMLNKFNTDENTIVKMKVINSDIVIGLCSPLMKRVHTLVKQSGDMVFVDGSAGMNHYGCNIYLMHTHSEAGGLPLGLIITTSLSEEVLVEGLSLLKQVFPCDAFYGRGSKGPHTIMTDNSQMEQKALVASFPDSTLLLCHFQILRAMGRYLWNAKHQIKEEDRPHILKYVKSMIYSKNEKELQYVYDAFCKDSKANKYSHVINHVKSLYKNRKDWVLCFRENLPDNTNNNCESAFRVLKDKIFFGSKAFNVPQLVDFLFKRLENVYEHKLLKFACNRWQEATVSRYMSITDWPLPKSSITQKSQNEYCVPSERDPDISYHVDMDETMCSCSMGLYGGPCKHQNMVAKHFDTSSLDTNPSNSPDLSRLFYKVATGKDGGSNWFEPLSNQREETVFVLPPTAPESMCISDDEGDSSRGMSGQEQQLDQCVSDLGTQGSVGKNDVEAGSSGHKYNTNLQCQHCSESLSDKMGRLKMLYITPSGVKIYECLKCRKKTACKIDPTTHSLTRANNYKCLKCGKTFTQESTLTTHSLTHTVKNYRCWHCGKTFAQESDLTAHFLTHGLKVYDCLQCGKIFTKESELTAHSQIHAFKKCRFTHCKKVFAEESDLATHYLTHIVPKNYSCSQCEEVFAKKSDFTAHTLTHNAVKNYNIIEGGRKLSCNGGSLSLPSETQGDKYECKLCGKQFSHVARFRAHYRLHQNSKDYSCEVCGKIFTSSRSLKTHYVKHGYLNYFKCKVCGKIFSHLHHLITHAKTHTMDYKCEDCGKLFARKNDLFFHSLVHIHEYRCIECGEVFANSDDLTNHCQGTHGDDAVRFVCSVCGKVFVEKEQLITHKLTHRVHKGYRCKECGKLFSHSRPLTTHTLVHHFRSKNYDCPECHEKFFTESYLTKHSCSHFDGVLTCEVCKACFLTKDSIAMHMKSHF